MAKKYWVNPPTGTPVGYSTREAAAKAAKSIRGAEVSTRKGPTRTLKALSALLRLGTNKPTKLPRGHRD